ncbi:phosphatidylinositol 3-kinase catalytic subunit type 3-like [Nilaparvata lugens]|uniref:phosphatidylinositol 3-kinase catalytic subunit type 3-like n=1 Tax=Nilaparvata lugens TaxID=108931 RepID=UPI00193CE93E|nr:phosphatidylinositol 3-kinase catalytic subunit type 3-like [Nilaparvata lugens]
MNFEPEFDTFRYVYSCNVDTPLQMKIGTLEGDICTNSECSFKDTHPARFKKRSIESDLIVTAQVFSDGRALTVPITSSSKAFSNHWKWNEWISFPLLFSDLPRRSLLALTVYYTDQGVVKPVGGTTVELFGKYGLFRQGVKDLKIWPHEVADGNVNTKTPGKIQGDFQKHSLLKLAKKHKTGELVKIDWLDKLTFREVEILYEMEKRKSNNWYLMIEFPQIMLNDISYSIVYYEKDGDDIYLYRTETNRLMKDPENPDDNLVEDKSHKLARSIRTGGDYDRSIKPNSTVRDSLNTIILYPSTTQLSVEEKDLIWKYRYYLSKQKKALSKFVKCVNWNMEAEAIQAIAMMEEWAPMDVEDALELLGPAFSHPSVRKYAISRLQQASDDDLLSYLLQLVQALRYEDFESIDESFALLPSSVSLTEYNELLNENSVIGEQNDNNSNNNVEDERRETPEESSSHLFVGASKFDLVNFLINRACANPILANNFYWYLSTECEEKDTASNRDIHVEVRSMFSKVSTLLLSALQTNSEKSNIFYKSLLKQQTFIKNLENVMKIVARESGNRTKKMEKLRSLLADSESDIHFTSFDKFFFPLDPKIQVKGIYPEKSYLFKSSMMPSLLSFITTDATEYITIFKNGDDLRQDQLVVQIINLMDKLLRNENLDLKLTPYKVLATSTKTGFVQYIQSVSIAEILSTEGTIQNFLRKNNFNQAGPYEIAPEIMDTYIKSCAGYCVITYILGVGDRHLDNLLLTSNGKLFHIDFGYILGRDPHPLPPPMKLTKEMIEAMGGVNSEQYKRFCKLCYTIFLHLRRHANLILNLFALMVDASVPDIALEPDKAVKKVQEKFRLDLEDEEACIYFKSQLDMSVTALMATVVERMHRFAQYMRK